MNIKIYAPLEPISVNAAYKNIRGAGRIKSGAYKRFKTDLLEFLESDYSNTKNAFLKSLPPFWYAQTTLIIRVPTSLYFKKDGDISISKKDLSNYRKCIQDIIFEWLGVEDKRSVIESNFQVPSKSWAFSFDITAIKFEKNENNIESSIRNLYPFINI